MAKRGRRSRQLDLFPEFPERLPVAAEARRAALADLPAPPETPSVFARITGRGRRP